MTVQEFLEDYDWKSALNEAVGGCYHYDYESSPDDPYKDLNAPAKEFAQNMKRVIACVKGERDEDDWLALIEMQDGRVAWLRAGCDYTGWDCRASGSVEYNSSIDYFLGPLGLTKRDRERMAESITAAGLKYHGEAEKADSWS